MRTEQITHSLLNTIEVYEAILAEFQRSHSYNLHLTEAGLILKPIHIYFSLAYSHSWQLKTVFNKMEY